MTESSAKNYAILRVGKIKMGNVNATAFHNLRLRETFNADPAKTNQNKILVGGKDLKGDLKNHLAKNGIDKFRKDAVVLAEVLLSASPDFFERANAWEKEDWERAQVNFLKEKYGEDLLQAVIHYDEKTPHVHAMICPIIRDKEKPRLAMKDHKNLSGKHNLTRLQSAYAREMEHLGLSRGEKKSHVKHQDIKTFYGFLEAGKNEGYTEVKKRTVNSVPWKDYETKNLFGKNTGLIKISDAKKIASSMVYTNTQGIARDIVAPLDGKRNALATNAKAHRNQMNDLIRQNAKLTAERERAQTAKNIYSSMEDLGLLAHVKGLIGERERERASMANAQKQRDAERVEGNKTLFGIENMKFSQEEETEEKKKNKMTYQAPKLTPKPSGPKPR